MPSFLVAIALGLAAPSPLAVPPAEPPATAPDQSDPAPPLTIPAPDTPATIDRAELSTVSDEILVRARRPHPASDPLQGLNMKTFAVMQQVDDKVVGPIANVYDGMPEPVRNGLHNFLKNLNEPVVFVNFVLQHKIGKASETLGRFTLNTVGGLGGFFDIAKRRPFRLPRRPNGFGNTLGFYGVKQGAYLFLPVIGPTTVRDLIGVIADRLVLPTLVGSPFNDPLYTIPAGAISVFDRRSEFDDELKLIRATSNPYASRRDSYLARRQAEIDDLRGHHARTEAGKAADRP